MTHTTDTSADLPSEALKTILSFMYRKALIHLSLVNRQFYHVIHSTPLTKKPLLKTIGLSIHRDQHSVEEEEWRMWVYMRTHWHKMGDRFHISEGAAHLESTISPEWVRYTFMRICLPREHEHRLAWLELLDENSHCLRGAWRLEVHYYDELEADLAELTHKFTQDAGVVETRLLRRN